MASAFATTTFFTRGFATGSPSINSPSAQEDHAQYVEWATAKLTIGALAALVGGSYALVLDFADGSLPTPDSFTAQIAVIGGAALTLYGRWVARRPIGG
ncbi:hypothetical protein J2Y48_004722 [Mycoplana sp. BE70]|uniref:hypothetical protein n=1 Tax=Mycoplana sp. BE70 TaxID=2817775 RepID=UPI0028556096|nr:hypothetical protein [Mycoplana sp. BE70]MDR6759406.1 hypothetical protein [Mycoplana sp. BE70]